MHPKIHKEPSALVILTPPLPPGLFSQEECQRKGNVVKGAHHDTRDHSSPIATMSCSLSHPAWIDSTSNPLNGHLMSVAYLPHVGETEAANTKAGTVLRSHEQQTTDARLEPVYSLVTFDIPNGFSPPHTSLQDWLGPRHWRSGSPLWSPQETSVEQT